MTIRRHASNLFEGTEAERDAFTPTLEGDFWVSTDTHTLTYWNGTEWVESGGGATLDELDDVDASSPLHMDSLVWDVDSNMWIPQPVGGALLLADMDDVNIPTPDNNDVLTYDQASDKWIPASISSVSVQSSCALVRDEGGSLGVDDWYIREFDTEDFDTDDYFDEGNALADSYFTAPRTGYFLVGYSFELYNTTEETLIRARFIVNGNTVDCADEIKDYAYPGGVSRQRLRITQLFHLNEGDYIQVQLYKEDICTLYNMGVRSFGIGSAIVLNPLLVQKLVDIGDDLEL